MKLCSADVINVSVLPEYRLYVQFEDGIAGEVDIAKLVPFQGIFEPLQDREFFARVSVNHDIGTICWDNGADLSPSYLYQHISSTTPHT